MKIRVVDDLEIVEIDDQYLLKSDTLDKFCVVNKSGPPHCGNSLICDHMGTILIMADENSNTALFCPCSTQLSQQMKKIDFRDYGVNQIATALSKEDIV
jgi:hypothetical protein